MPCSGRGPPSPMPSSATSVLSHHVQPSQVGTGPRGPPELPSMGQAGHRREAPGAPCWPQTVMTKGPAAGAEGRTPAGTLTADVAGCHSRAWRRPKPSQMTGERTLSVQQTQTVPGASMANRPGSR